MICDTGAQHSLVIRTLVRLIARHGRGFAGRFAAALPTKVAILFLCGRNQPKTATRIAQDRRSKQPLVEPYLLFYPHPSVPLFAAVGNCRALRFLNYKIRESFNKLCQLRGRKDLRRVYLRLNLSLESITMRLNQFSRVLLAEWRKLR